MRRASIVAIGVGFVTVWIALASGVAAVWLTGEMRVFGLAVLPAAVVASLLVVFFEWRARLVAELKLAPPAGTRPTSLQESQATELSTASRRAAVHP